MASRPPDGSTPTRLRRWLRALYRRQRRWRGVSREPWTRWALTSRSVAYASASERRATVCREDCATPSQLRVNCAKRLQQPKQAVWALDESCKNQCCSVRERSTAQRAHCKSPARIRIGEWPWRGLRGGGWLGGRVVTVYIVVGRHDEGERAAALRHVRDGLMVKRGEMSDFGTAWRRPLGLSGHTDWLSGSSRKRRAAQSQR